MQASHVSYALALDLIVTRHIVAVCGSTNSRTTINGDSESLWNVCRSIWNNRSSLKSLILPQLLVFASAPGQERKVRGNETPFVS